MAEQIESVAKELNDDVEEIEEAKQPIVEEIQTIVEENPINNEIEINDDGTSSKDKVEMSDAGNVQPVVDIVPATEDKGKDYRLNNKFGAKTAEGESPYNSDLNYQSMFGLGTK